MSLPLRSRASNSARAVSVCFTDTVLRIKGQDVQLTVPWQRIVFLQR